MRTGSGSAYAAADRRRRPGRAGPRGGRALRDDQVHWQRRAERAVAGRFSRPAPACVAPRSRAFPHGVDQAGDGSRPVATIRGASGSLSAVFAGYPGQPAFWSGRRDAPPAAAWVLVICVLPPRRGPIDN